MNPINSSFSLFRDARIREVNKGNVRYASITKIGTESFIYEMSASWVLIIHYSTAPEFLIKFEYILTHLVNL